MSALEVEAPTLYAMVIPDDHFSRLEDILEKAKDHVAHIADKNRVVNKFYYEDGVIHADREDGDRVIKQKVIKQSEVEAFKTKHSDFKDHLAKRIKNDFPDMSEEQLNQDVDILNEANESIKNLIKSGIPAEIAKSIIMGVLDTRQEIKSPEDLAALIGTLKEKIEGEGAADKN
jgi:hypothetical protein